VSKRSTKRLTWLKLSTMREEQKEPGADFRREQIPSVTPQVPATPCLTDLTARFSW
jgi:hypothetical protein